MKIKLTSNEKSDLVLVSHFMIGTYFREGNNEYAFLGGMYNSK